VKVSKGTTTAKHDAPPAAVGRQRFVLLVTAVLYLFGLVMVASATSGSNALAGGDPWSYVRRQLLWGAMGVVLMAIAMRIPIRVVRHTTHLLLAGATAALFLVFVPGVGQAANGATRWLSVGSFSLQPSEFVKLGIVIYLASYLASRPAPVTWKGFWQSPGGIAFALCLIIFVQRDLGSAMIVGAVIVTLYMVSGTQWRLLGQTLGPVIGLAILGIALEPFRRERFIAFLNPWGDPQGSGFQLVQGLIAIGSGGPFGVGLGHSVQKIHYVPEAHTDMIFAIIGEELGLVGVGIVVVGFFSLAVVGMRIATSAADRFQSLLAVGLITSLIGQAVLNLAGVVGVLPLTGVPLPLVSYGGSSLLVTFISLGLLANIAVSSREQAPTPTQDTERAGSRWRHPRSSGPSTGRGKRTARARA
jgi:cell division protein FtsW